MHEIKIGILAFHRSSYFYVSPLFTVLRKGKLKVHSSICGQRPPAIYTFLREEESKEENPPT